MEQYEFRVNWKSAYMWRLIELRELARTRDGLRDELEDLERDLDEMNTCSEDHESSGYLDAVQELQFAITTLSEELCDIEERLSRGS